MEKEGRGDYFSENRWNSSSGGCQYNHEIDVAVGQGTSVLPPVAL